MAHPLLTALLAPCPLMPLPPAPCSLSLAPWLLAFSCTPAPWLPGPLLLATAPLAPCPLAPGPLIHGSWFTGPAGPAGPAGPTGPAGPAGPSRTRRAPRYKHKYCDLYSKEKLWWTSAYNLIDFYEYSMSKPYCVDSTSFASTLHAHHASLPPASLIDPLALLAPCPSAPLPPLPPSLLPASSQSPPRIATLNHQPWPGGKREAIKYSRPDRGRRHVRTCRQSLNYF